MFLNLKKKFKLKSYNKNNKKKLKKNILNKKQVFANFFMISHNIFSVIQESVEL